MWNFNAKLEAYKSADKFIQENIGKKFIVGFYETGKDGGGAYVDPKRITGRIYRPDNLRSPVWIFSFKEDNKRATARIEVTRAVVRAEIEAMKDLLRAHDMLVEKDVACTSRVEINSVAA